MQKEQVSIKINNEELKGELIIPENPKGLVIFAHGSGSSRFSPRNQFVAQILNKAEIATLLFDLLTEEEEEIDEVTSQLRFDINLLSERLFKATEWIKQSKAKDMDLGYFGASTGSAAALIASSKRNDIKAIVSRGGRPDLAAVYLENVYSPTLFIVGELDSVVIDMNEEALELVNADKKLIVIPGAGHLFEEPGTLGKVAEYARNWFLKYFSKAE